MDDEKLLEELAESMMPDTSPSPVPMPGVPVQKITEASNGAPDRIVMPDEEISSIIEAHITASQNWLGTAIALEQAKAMEYYLGQAEGELAPPETPDRSKVVDTVVSDQIEWLMPGLMEIFFGSSKPVKFTPRKPGDEPAAEQMTHLANYVVRDQNPGFEVFLDWFKTALLSKVGICKVWWCEETENTQESYTGMTDDQFAILADDPDVTITKVTSYVDPNAERAAMDAFNAQQAAFQAPRLPAPTPAPGAALPPPQGAPGAPPPGAPVPPPAPPQPPQPIDISKLPQLHDVVVTISKKSGHVAMEAINNEDFLIAQKSRRIRDGFCADRVKKTISDLRAEGYKNVDDISSEKNAETVESSALALARTSLENQFSLQMEDDGSGDESMREVWLWECYLPIDCDGDGIAEWRKITKSGDTILDNEVCDGPPYAALCPIRIPGLFHGRSIADLAMPVQMLKTGVLRGLQDNMNLQINGRSWIIEKNVNMDDFLTNRPGGGVRVKNGATDIGPISQGMADSAGAYQFLQYVDTMAQERTGVTKYSQGLDSDTLNHTASGIKNITQRADLRTKLIARSFAETGVKDLFRLIQKLLMNYQDKNMAFQLNGGWVDVDPRVWRNQYSMTVTVGTGTGDTSERVQQLMNLLGVQQQIRANPDPMIASTVTAENVAKTTTELVQALQLGEPSQFFSPPKAPPAPAAPPPDPIQQQVQGQIQIETTKAKLQQQTDMAKLQEQARQANQEAQLKAQLESQHETLLDQRERDQATQNLAWEREKFYAQLAADREKAAFMGKVTDPTIERAMNDSIQQDQVGEQDDAISNEFRIANELLQRR